MLRMRRLNNSALDRLAVETVILAASDYSLLVVGRMPSAAEDVDDFFLGLPPGRSLEDKHPLGFFVGERLVGVADVVRGWNSPNKAIIGLLLFVPESRSVGNGRDACSMIEQYVREWHCVDTIRIAVVDCNTRALSFWHRNGFVETGERRSKEFPYTGDRVVLEKLLKPVGE